MLLLLAATGTFAQQRRLLAKAGFTEDAGVYRPLDAMSDSSATEFTYLNADSSITIELRKVAGGALLRRDEYRGKRPIGTWTQQYDATRPALKTVYDVEAPGTLASCPTSYIYELGTESLSFGAMAGDFTPPVLVGDKSVMEFLIAELHYPRGAKERGVHGKVRIKGILTEDGELTNLAISKSVDRDLDAEVYRVVQKMRFKGPALVDGKPARLCVSLPVSFEIQ